MDFVRRIKCGVMFDCYDKIEKMNSCHIIISQFPNPVSRSKKSRTYATSVSPFSLNCIILVLVGSSVFF